MIVASLCVACALLLYFVDFDVVGVCMRFVCLFRLCVFCCALGCFLCLFVCCSHILEVLSSFVCFFVFEVPWVWLSWTV